MKLTWYVHVRGMKMNEYNYIVWVGGSVIGEYESLNEAQEVADDWILDGYEDTRIELKEKEYEI